MQKLPIILLGAGVLLAAGALIFGWFAFPAIIQSKISQQVRLVEGGDTWKKWENIPIPIYMSVYIFNITNPEELKEGKKPIVEELGPYVYQQKRVKTEVEVNEDNDSVFYKQPVYYHFRPDMTNGSLDDVISMINLPYVGLAAKANREQGVVRSTIQNVLMEEYPDTEPLYTLTVDEFLFKGQHLPFMQYLAEMKNEVLLPNNTFGIYYNKNGSDTGLLEVFAGVKDSAKFGNIASWNNAPNVTFWEDEYCNMINGSDGALFPPFVTRDRILPIFSPDLCRSLYLTYESDTEVLGLPGYRFTLPKILLEDPRTNKDNECFCTNRGGQNFENCPKAGAYQIESCKKGTPLVVSLPHFLDGDAEYTEQVGGLNADPAKHETVITLEPNTGVLLRANKRIQMNVELRGTRKFPKLKKFPNIIMPLFWVDESAELTETSADRIQSKLIKPQEVVGTAMWVIFAVGCVLIIIGLIAFARGARSSSAQQKF
ncbi:Scavenger receptor class B member 1 [Orchesella cincta]|uniref:Scavenger receptor class B member 1 n=1 Tax=Orchesella cincta TaxID=48709 RepID=A0A1D2NHL8_ORCCI|nr:Scavenger receptor class B member 1 [Orchesella cincta]